MVASLDPVTPVIADADTGFGGPAMVARTIFQYDRAGIAACHIEDQVQTKRCGHLLGKQVVSREEFVTRIRAAVIARDQIPGGSDFVIIGRTDSAQVHGMDEAIYRLKLAAAAGADVCFIEGVKTEELLRKTVAELAPTPVLVNVISGGLTPSFTSFEAERMGAKIISEHPRTRQCRSGRSSSSSQSSPLCLALPHTTASPPPCGRSRRPAQTLRLRRAWTRRRSSVSWVSTRWSTWMRGPAARRSRSSDSDICCLFFCHFFSALGDSLCEMYVHVCRCNHNHSFGIQTEGTASDSIFIAD
jgi:hypothetical protein